MSTTNGNGKMECYCPAACPVHGHPSDRLLRGCTAGQATGNSAGKSCLCQVCMAILRLKADGTVAGRYRPSA